MGKQKSRASRKADGAGSRAKSVPRMLVSTTPLQNRMVTLTFASQFAATESAAGTGVYNFYRLNGPYDPDTAVLSDSTPGLAALTNLYRSMRVMRATVEAAGCFHSLSTTAAQLCIVPTAFQPVLPSNPRYWPVQPKTAYSYGNSTVLSTYGATGYCTGTFPKVRKDFTIHDVMNVTRQQYLDEADFASLTNSNPTRQAYFALAVTGISGSPINVAILLKIRYVIEFFDPYPLQ